MSEFVIQTPSEDSNCTQSITTSIDDEYITLSDTEYGSQYITIPLDKWQELKERIDANLPIKRRLTDQEQIEQIKADPELAERMISTGAEILYAKDRFCYMWWSQKGYKLTLVDNDPFNKDEKLFDNADDFKVEFLKLSDRNANRDWNQDFDDFMFGVNDIKKCYGIGGDDE